MDRLNFGKKKSNILQGKVDYSRMLYKRTEERFVNEISQGSYDESQILTEARERQERNKKLQAMNSSSSPAQAASTSLKEESLVVSSSEATGPLLHDSKSDHQPQRIHDPKGKQSLWQRTQRALEPIVQPSKAEAYREIRQADPRTRLPWQERLNQVDGRLRPAETYFNRYNRFKGKIEDKTSWSIKIKMEEKIQEMSDLLQIIQGHRTKIITLKGKERYNAESDLEKDVGRFIQMIEELKAIVKEKFTEKLEKLIQDAEDSMNKARKYQQKVDNMPNNQKETGQALPTESSETIGQFNPLVTQFRQPFPEEFLEQISQSIRRARETLRKSGSGQRETDREGNKATLSADEQTLQLDRASLTYQSSVSHYQKSEVTIKGTSEAYGDLAIHFRDLFKRLKTADQYPMTVDYFTSQWRQGANEERRANIQGSLELRNYSPLVRDRIYLDNSYPELSETEIEKIMDEWKRKQNPGGTSSSKDTAEVQKTSESPARTIAQKIQVDVDPRSISRLAQERREAIKNVRTKGLQEMPEHFAKIRREQEDEMRERRAAWTRMIVSGS